jgi:glycosyltransferase involved in cell wall biosynthesis
VSEAVTVVVAAHRAAAFLDQALASVAAQDRPCDAVVVVDDASPDATADVARAWDGRLPITVIRRDDNGGPAVARHDGILAAATPLIALLDADDVWLPDHLRVMTATRSGPDEIVTADALRWVPGEHLATTSVASSLPLPLPADQLHALIRRNFVFVGTLFERSLYDRVGGFRPQFRGTEDWDLWIRMVRAGARITRATHPTVLYRATGGSLSGRDAQVDEDRKVVEAALREAATPAERAVARAAVRAVTAQKALYDAYDAAHAGDVGAARRHARGALRGTRRVAMRGVAMTLAPRAVARRRARARSSLGGRMRI